MAVAVFWFALYRDAPLYPPRLEWPIAVAAVFFLCAVTLIHQLHATVWPGIAQFGFVVSAVGLVLWMTGGAMSSFARLLLQPGWGLFCVGLIPIGVGAIRQKLSLSMRLLLPLGCLFFFGPPLKYLLGDRAGGLIVLVAFGVGWLTIGALLLFESDTDGHDRDAIIRVS
jgi:hypothetical protein